MLTLNGQCGVVVQKRTFKFRPCSCISTTRSLPQDPQTTVLCCALFSSLQFPRNFLADKHLEHNPKNEPTIRVTSCRYYYSDMQCNRSSFLLRTLLLEAETIPLSIVFRFRAADLASFSEHVFLRNSFTYTATYIYN
jgi:hypothetical protein